MAGEKTLIVEDEGIVARETEYRLKDLGYSVCGIAASGSEAIKKAEKDHPDLVLMDIMLKGAMDGIDTAEQIHSKLPVVYFYEPAVELLTRWKLNEASGTPVTQVLSVVSGTLSQVAVRAEFMLNSGKMREQCR